jgi:antitoxin FitA
MPNLSIKNVPASIVERLRLRAERNHRSLQGELMAIILAATEGQVLVPALTPGYMHDRKSIEQIARAHRKMRKKPETKGPIAIDVLRADRDAR